jgi:hypothetical protein
VIFGAGLGYCARLPASARPRNALGCGYRSLPASLNGESARAERVLCGARTGCRELASERSSPRPRVAQRAAFPACFAQRRKCAGRARSLWCPYGLPQACLRALDPSTSRCAGQRAAFPACFAQRRKCAGRARSLWCPYGLPRACLRARERSTSRCAELRVPFPTLWHDQLENKRGPIANLCWAGVGRCAARDAGAAGTCPP